MAVTVKCYGKVSGHLEAGDIDWAGDTIKLALATSSYGVNQATDEFFSDVTNEVAAGGNYPAGGFTLTTIAPAYDSGTREERFDANDVSVASLTPASPFRYGIVYDATPGSPSTDMLIAFLNFGADQDPAGLPFAIQWATTGVFYMQAS